MCVYTTALASCLGYVYHHSSFLDVLLTASAGAFLTTASLDFFGLVGAMDNGKLFTFTDGSTVAELASAAFMADCPDGKCPGAVSHESLLFGLLFGAGVVFQCRTGILYALEWPWNLISPSTYPSTVDGTNATAPKVIEEEDTAEEDDVVVISPPKPRQEAASAKCTADILQNTATKRPTPIRKHPSTQPSPSRERSAEPDEAEEAEEAYTIQDVADDVAYDAALEAATLSVPELKAALIELGSVV